MDLRAVAPGLPLLAVCWPPLDFDGSFHFAGTFPYGPCGAGANAVDPRFLAAAAILRLEVRLP